MLQGAMGNSISEMERAIKKWNEHESMRAIWAWWNTLIACFDISEPANDYKLISSAKAIYTLFLCITHNGSGLLDIWLSHRTNLPLAIHDIIYQFRKLLFAYKWLVSDGATAATILCAACVCLCVREYRWIDTCCISEYIGMYLYKPITCTHVRSADINNLPRRQ